MATLIVAVTGGIAAGKSLVDRTFAALGVPVFDADLIAREIVAPGEPALRDIVAAFGDNVLRSDGSLDRMAMRARVFDDADERRKLEGITHPRIRTMLFERCKAVDAPFAVASVPLLAEVGALEAYSWLHRVLVVDAPVSLQRRRLVARDRLSPALADRMISAQASRPRRLSIANDVLVNDSDVASAEAIVTQLAERYRALAEPRRA